MTLFKPNNLSEFPFPIPSHWGVGLQDINLGEEDTNIQATAPSPAWESRERTFYNRENA